ncbi:MAG: hypothetical protein WDO13_09450 [Verrucomicrobiota bacterium]
MSCETCSTNASDAALGRSTRFFLFLLALALGGFFIASLPEIKRYIRLSSM